jgi:sugar phosphate isomerase/epimerase
MIDLTGNGEISLGASTLGYRHDPLDVALGEIAAAGFDLVDVAMYPSYCPHFNALTASEDQIVALEKALSDRGLKVAVLNSADGLLGVPSLRSAALEYARASLRLARRLGASGVTMQSGPEPGRGEDWRIIASSVVADFRALGDYSELLGLNITVELHKEMLMATSQQALDLMEMIDHPSVGVAVDPSHATFAGERAADVVRALGSLVKHVHLRDGRGKDIMVVPGDGDVDFSELSRSLLEVNYRGAAVIELEYEEAHPPQVTIDLRRAKEFVQNQMRVM